jgi:hypothetical protein
MVDKLMYYFVMLVAVFFLSIAAIVIGCFVYTHITQIF